MIIGLNDLLFIAKEVLRTIRQQYRFRSAIRRAMKEDAKIDAVAASNAVKKISALIAKRNEFRAQIVGAYDEGFGVKDYNLLLVNLDSVEMRIKKLLESAVSIGAAKKKESALYIQELCYEFGVAA